MHHKLYPSISAWFFMRTVTTLTPNSNVVTNTAPPTNSNPLSTKKHDRYFIRILTVESILPNALSTALDESYDTTLFDNKQQNTPSLDPLFFPSWYFTPHQSPSLLLASGIVGNSMSKEMCCRPAREMAEVAVILVLAIVLMAAAGVEAKSKLKTCSKGWECTDSIYCCNETISDFFQVYQFENLFSKRNSPVAHAVGFWDYHSFITASTVYQPLGFGTTGGKQMGMKEVAAFLGHVGSKTSCGYGVATGGPLAWGLCYNHEMSPSQSYCKEDYLYPCTPGAEYHGRGALPVYWNYNYGIIGDGLKADLLNHPEYLEQNASLAFQAAMWRWMNPIKKKLPSAHDVFVGNWKPTKNDTLAKRLPGFGATMNVLYGDEICGQGFVDSMNNFISHYQYYLDLMGIGRQNSGDGLDCAEQEPFSPSVQPASS